MYPGLHPLRPLFSNLPKLLFGNFKTLTPYNPSQRLLQRHRDCFGRPLTPYHLAPWPPLAAPPAVPQRLLRKAFLSHVTWRLGRTLCFYDLPKLLFGTLKCLEPLAAPPAMPQRLLRKASHAISPGALAAHSVFMTFRNCFLAPSNAWNPSQRLQQCPRDCFGRPLTPSHLAPWPHTLFL